MIIQPVGGVVNSKQEKGGKSSVHKDEKLSLAFAKAAGSPVQLMMVCPKR